MVVLSVLLGSVLAAALAGPARPPLVRRSGRTSRELFAFLCGAGDAAAVERPGARGVPDRDRREPLAARPGRARSRIPVGVGAAVFLEEYAPPGRLRRIIQTNIANLAGVPSIVYGILGLALFVRAFGVKALALGPTLWAGALTLEPADPAGDRDRHPGGAADRAATRSARRPWRWGRPAGRWSATTSCPSALPGILTGTILGLSRAIGETAPLLMVGAAGSILRLPEGPVDRYTALPVEIYNYAKEPNADFQTVAAGGILLLLVLLLVDERHGHRDPEPVPALHD